MHAAIVNKHLTKSQYRYILNIICHLIRPIAATWHICDYCIISESTGAVAAISLI
jgi:hypothetical protein